MNKKNYSREVKIGIMVVIAILISYFGLNFLKGIDIFSPVKSYYATYDQLDGLVPSSPVFIKGLKVGQVEEVIYNFNKNTPFVIRISVNKDITIPQNAHLELFDNGLMGGKAVQLVFEPSNAVADVYQAGDTINSTVAIGLMTQVAGDLMPQIKSIALQADSLLRSIRSITESQQVQNSLRSIETTTTNLAHSSVQLKQLINSDVPKIMHDVNGLTSDLKKITGNLSTVDFAATFSSINHTINNLNLVTGKLTSTEGTIGLLLNDKALYNNLNAAVVDADKLLIDLKQNPKRYIHFSLFGSKQN